MARILPERTVEAWTTAYIVRWFPTALLWAPTQLDPLNWDAAVGLPSHRYFILEYKGVEHRPDGAVVIPIDTAQLTTYRDDNAHARAELVWYLLPCWTETVAPGTPLPGAAALRTIRAAHPNGNPPRPPGPQAVPAARAEHALARGCETYFYLASPGALLRAVDAKAAHPGLPIDRVPDVARGVALEHFVGGLHAGNLGVSWRQLQEVASRTDRPGRDGASRTTTVFAVPGLS